MGTFYTLAACLQVKSALRFVVGTTAFLRFHLKKKKTNVDLYHSGRLNGVSFISVLLPSSWEVGWYFLTHPELGALQSGLVLPWLK